MRPGVTPLVQVEDLHVHFGAARAVDGASLQVLPGEVAERFRSREVTIVGAGRYLELWSPDDLKTNVTPLDFA